jgi:hypothetical protein
MHFARILIVLAVSALIAYGLPSVAHSGGLSVSPAVVEKAAREADPSEIEKAQQITVTPLDQLKESDLQGSVSVANPDARSSLRRIEAENRGIQSSTRNLNNAIRNMNTNINRINNVNRLNTINRSGSFNRRF